MGKKRKPMSEETKEKIRRSLTGRKLPEETKRKISEARNRQNPPSEETREKLRVATKRRWDTQERVPVSEETRRKMSEAHKGKKMPPRSDEWRQKRSALLTGRKQSAAANAKRSATLKGRVVTDEHRHNLSKALKGRFTGPASNLWKDGRTKAQAYPEEFNVFLKKRVREHYKERCGVCGKSAYKKKGCVHHIDSNKLNNAFENLMLVCKVCHTKIHNRNPVDDPEIIRLRGLLT